MRLHSSAHALAVLACLVGSSRIASADGAPDLWRPPKMHTENWPTTEQIGGAAVLLPPNFHSTGNSSGLVDEKTFVSGRKREITIGAGRAPRSQRTTSTMERISAPTPGMPADDGVQTSQISSCTTTISGRQVEITFESATLADRSTSDASNSGTTYSLTAHFPSSGSLGEMFIVFRTDMRSEISDYRQLFWAVTFDNGSRPSSATSASATPAAAPCVQKPDKSLPVPDAVLDTALVQTLFTGSGTAPHGFALMSLAFNGSGALTNISVVQSDLPDAAQKQLATLVASNLKAHDKHTPSSFMLRVDAADASLQYAVQPACSK